MRKIFLLTVIVFTGTLVFGQQKKSKKISPPPPIKMEAPLERVKTIEEVVTQETKKCFVYTLEEQKDSLFYVSKNLLEYGWAGDNARMVITSYNYDPIEKKEVEKDGQMLFFPDQQMQFINGSYKKEQEILIFTPDKADKFGKRTFRVVYKLKTKIVDHLLDENNNKYLLGDCQEAIVGK